MKEPVRRSHSLIFKLFGVILIALLVVNVVVFSFWHHSRREGESSRPERHLRQYGLLLLRELPSPVDTVKAKAMAENLGIEVRLNRSGQLWQTSNAESVWRDLRRDKSMAVNDSIALLWRHGQAGAIRTGHSDTLILMASMRPFFPASGAIAGLLGLLTLVLAGAAFGMRHLLKPMRKLQRGVDAVARGDFSYRLPETGHDEVARLAAAFNAMAASVEQRIAARNQLLNDVSHELRSPLTRLRLAAEMLDADATAEANANAKANAKVGSDIGALRADLLEDISVLEAMVQEILEGERLNSPAGGLVLEPCDLAVLVRETVAAQGNRPPGIISRIEKDTHFFKGDAERLRLVLSNLLDNALKYSQGAAGKVVVELSIRNDGGHMLTVRDQGPGIPEAERERIFEPFYRVDRARTLGLGFGLGLALAKRICDAHGISITVASNSDGGSCFRLDFPATA
jgi:signal transduction histidine kinase